MATVPGLTRAMVLRRARETLARAGIPSPDHDAEALVRCALRIGRTALWTEPGAAVSGAESARLAALLEARGRRVPLQLLLGEVDFHGTTLLVEPGVFVPRPETESLVERALEALRPAGAHPAGGVLLDLGTGTGAIAIALLLALPPGWSARAFDRSGRACELARRNARRNGVEDRLTVARADFREGGLPGLSIPADALVANLPYIPTGVISGLMPEVRDHDPREALDGGPDGLDAFRVVAATLPAWLRAGGLLALEIGHDQADACLELCGPHLVGARVTRDLAGMPRILTGRMRGTGRCA